jgi:hypothetical protein
MNGHVVTGALAPLEFLVGSWTMTLSEASFLSDSSQTVAGRVLFEPFESGTILVMRQFGDDAGTPLASWVIGRDDSRSDYTILYADNRGVSRV